jgi:hypothetical protein
MAPFGHIGEQILNKVSFEKFGLYFEANANNLSIIQKRMKGISLFTTIATIKYPYLINSKEDGKGLYNGQIDLYKKEIDFAILQQNKITGFNNERLIETEILEIADDISYLFGDFEDLIRVFVGNKKDLWESIMKILFRNNIHDFDVINSFKTALLHNDLYPLVYIKNELIKNIGFSSGKLVFNQKNGFYENILLSLREITWDEYISKFSISSEHHLSNKWEQTIAYIFDNIEKPDIVKNFIFSSSLLIEYKNKLKQKYKNEVSKQRELGKIIILSLSELSDTYAMKCISIYENKIKEV